MILSITDEQNHLVGRTSGTEESHRHLQRRPDVRTLGRAVRDLVTLPWCRVQVRRLATPSERALPELTIDLDRRAAAEPSEQPVQLTRSRPGRPGRSEGSDA